MASVNKLQEIQQIQFNFFKSQDPETGNFDVVFEVGGKKLYAYKSILPVLSSTFKSMLSDSWTKKDEPLKITGYSFKDFFEFLTFIYSGDCKLTDKNIFVMVDIAEFYQIAPFKTYCDEFLSKVTLNIDNIFQFLDLTNKYSMIHLKNSVKTFIAQNCVHLCSCDNFLMLNKSFITDIIQMAHDVVKQEDLFQAIYKWAEKQAKDNRKVDPNFNLNDSIKNEISDFLPQIAFKKMKMQFLLKFVVPRGFIFPSLDDLSQILSNIYSTPERKVMVTNNRGQKLHGSLIPDETVIESIESLKNILSDNVIYNGLVGVYDNDGFLKLASKYQISKNDYLLAEMFGQTEFETTAHCHIKIL